MTGTFAGNDRFLVLSQLGIGGMGVVYEALDCERQVRVAIKTLRIQGAKQLVRFKNEFRALRDIRHPNLVELGELFEEGGTWFFTMDLVEGVDFITYVRGDDPDQLFDEQRLRQALRGLGAGLVALHRADKVHCDVKPSNVLVTVDGRVVLLDFGVVTQVSRDHRSGQNPRAGSPLYMAPEQAAGKPVGPAADWYAAGVLLFQAMTGDVPIRGRKRGEVMKRKQRENPPHPSTRRPGLPRDLADLCVRMIGRASFMRPDEHEILSTLGISEQETWTYGQDGDSSRRLFVGRLSAMAMLEAAYRSSRTGKAVSVFVEGDSGMGKTALIEHFIATLEQRADVSVFRGQCHEREFVRYNAFDGIVDAGAGFLRMSPDAAQLVAEIEYVEPLLHLFPVLRTVPCLQERDAEVMGDMRAQAFAAARQLIAAIARERALVIVVDDAHWADADSLALFREFVGDRDSPKMLFLATARKSDDGRSCMAVQMARGDVRRIELQGLDSGEAEQLAQRLLQRFSITADVDVRAIIDETGGHPLFMDELVRHIARHKGDEVGLQVAHLDDALRERISELDTDAQRILHVVAVAGFPVSHDIVAKTAGLPAEAFAHGLSVLRSAHLVRMTGRNKNAVISAYHSRVREAVYAHLADDMKVSLHFQLARVMESRNVDPVQLAIHFHRGGDAEKTAQHAAWAAHKAMGALAFDQAAELYQMAISAVSIDGAGDPRRRDLLTALGTALQNAGRTKEAAKAYTDAADHAEAADWLELHRRAAEQLMVGGYMEEGIAAVRTVLGHSGMKLPKTSKRALPAVAWHFFRLRHHDLQWKVPSPEEQARASYAERAKRIDVCWTAGAGLSLVDSLRGVFFAVRGARMALRLGEPYRVARSLCTSAVSAAALGSKDSAERMTRAALRAAEQDGTPDSMFYARLARFVYDFYYRQNWSHSVDSGRRMERMWRAAGRGRGFEIDFVIQFCSWALGMRGDIEALTRFVEMFVSDAQRVGNHLLEVALRVYHSLVHLAVDDPQRAREDVRDAIESWLPGNDDFHLSHAWAFLSLGDVLLYQQRPFEQAQLAPMLRRLQQSSSRRTQWVLWRKQYLLGRFSLARATELSRSDSPGRISTELEQVAAMVGKLEQCVAPVPRAWGALLAAGAAKVIGDSDRVVVKLRRAGRVFEDTHSGLHVNATAYRLGQTLGGSAGRTLMDEALASMHSRGVKRAERMVTLLAPGWG